MHVFKSRVRAKQCHSSRHSRIRCAVFASGLIFAPALSSQQPKATAAEPVPAQIVAARKVFLSNAGADIVSQTACKRAGEPDQAYTYFYSAMQSWGRYEIVSAPADADLVFEIGLLPQSPGARLVTSLKWD
jgi:hypothetical protein